MTDGQLVCVKGINTTLGNTQEVQVALMFSRDSLRDDPRNHCVPILDVFQDAQNPAISYIVMPYLRPIEDPPFETVSDVLDFVSQMLEVGCMISLIFYIVERWLVRRAWFSCTRRASHIGEYIYQWDDCTLQ